MIFNLICFPCLNGLGGFLRKTSKHLSLARSKLIFHSFRSLLITLFHIFLGSTFTRPSILFHSFKISVIYLVNIPSYYSFNSSIVLNSLAEILSPGLLLHIDLTIIASFLSTLITSSSSTSQFYIA